MLKVGVIGTGNIGTDHVRRIAGRVCGAEVVAVFDVATGAAASLAATVGARAHRTAADLIDDPSVDAVVIASPGDTHAELTLGCLDAGKPVLCEKPLATTVEGCRKVLDAEQAAGRRMVQVGFMRRYDPWYRAVKSAIDGGSIGEVLLAHCVHRNVSVPDTFTNDMSITDSAIHEIDITRWLFDQEIVAATVVAARPSPLIAAGLRDPQLVLLETAGGIVVDVEIFLNCRYGYEVGCEVVGSTGTVSLETPNGNTIRRDGSRAASIPSDWRVRFADAYQEELQAWVDGLRDGVAGGPGAWDGYAATAVADACVASQASGRRTEVTLLDRPPVYR